MKKICWELDFVDILLEFQKEYEETSHIEDNSIKAVILVRNLNFYLMLSKRKVFFFFFLQWIELLNIESLQTRPDDETTVRT